MPLYEYKCDVCGRIVAEIRTVSEMNTTKACDKEGCNGKLVKDIRTVGNVISNNVPLS